MPSDKKYSIISVQGDDEVVIHAGLSSSDGVESEALFDESKESSVTVVPFDDHAPETVLRAEEPDASFAQRPAEPEGEAADLSEPMPGVRRIILVSALVFLVAFLVYFNVPK